MSLRNAVHAPKAARSSKDAGKCFGTCVAQGRSMRNQTGLLLIAMLTTACGSNSCSQSSSGCSQWRWTEEATPTATPPTQTSSTSTTSDATNEQDAIAFEETDAGVFAVASVHSTGEVRFYRIEATDVDEAPITVTLARRARVQDGDAPAHVADRVLVTIDDASAYVDDGDAYLHMGSEEAFTRIGAPGITRGVALADVRGEGVTRRVVVVQTEQPRMLVFYEASDTTMPVAFEPLE
jgi:hypothetical protein